MTKGLFKYDLVPTPENAQLQSSIHKRGYRREKKWVEQIHTIRSYSVYVAYVICVLFG